MNPELISAIVERLRGGQTKDTIVAELVATGYPPDQADTAYQEAVAIFQPSPDHNATVNDTVDITPIAEAPATVVLPGIAQLLQQGWNFALAQPILLGLFSFGLVILPVVVSVMSVVGSLSTFVISLIEGIGGLVALVTWIIALGSAIYMNAQPSGVFATITDGRRWLANNLFAYIVLSLMATLVFFGGFLLFIIPGFVITLYSMFSYFVMARFNQRYLTALTWSHVLVRGYWWPVAGRILTLFVAFFLPLIMVSMMSELLGIPEFISALLTGIITTLFMMISISVYGQIFTTLADRATLEMLTREAKSLRKWYIGLMVLGPIGWFATMGVMAFGMLLLASATMGF